MGKLSKGILGGFRGKLGPAVGSSWKGLDVIRSRPPRKRRKSTEGQLKQMAKLKLMTGFVHPLTNLLNRTYNSVTFQMSCFNKALSYNMRNAIGGDYPAFAINYARVVLGVGDLLNVETLTVASASEGKLTFSWTDNSGEGSALATDKAFAAVYCEAGQGWLTSDDGAARNAGSYTFDVVQFSGKAVHAYIGFLSADARFVSTSLYAGMVNVL
jgi:Family of unknown function (DUF6266)